MCISLHDVIYSQELQVKIIEEILQVSLISAKGSKEVFAEFVFQNVSRFSTIFKIKEFQEEKEWRIIYSTLMMGPNNNTFKTTDNRDDIGFIHNNNSIKSYFPLIISEEKFVQSIDTIILGPKNNTFDFEIQAYLAKNDFINTKIKKSTIPYR
jgi:hypothetical protein